MPKLKTKTVQTLEQYISVVEEFRINRKGPLWYRGCGKLAHKLKPSLYRHKGSKAIEDFIRLEKLLLAKFQQRSVPFTRVPWLTHGNGCFSCSTMECPRDFLIGQRVPLWRSFLLSL